MLLSSQISASKNQLSFWFLHLTIIINIVLITVEAAVDLGVLEKVVGGRGLGLVETDYVKTG